MASDDTLKDRLFRKAALDRLSSPDQLDATLQVVTVRSWIVLLPLLLAIAAGVAWGFAGAIPTVVAGTGIITHVDGLSEITSPANGVVVKMHRAVGDQVVSGDLVAELHRSDIALRLERAESRIELLRRRLDEVRERGERIGAVQTSVNRAQHEDLDAKARLLDQRIANAREQAQVLEQLLRDGLTTSQQLIAAREQQSAFELERQAVRAQRDALRSQRLQEERALSDEAQDLRHRLFEAIAERDVIAEEFRHATRVVSTFTGRVAELQAEAGQSVPAGRTLMTIDRDDGDVTVEVIGYVSSREAKKIRTGAMVEVMPTNIKRAEAGFLWGRVRYVSPYPSSAEGIAVNFQNQVLVRQLLADSVRTEVRVELLRDPQHPERPWWSDGQSGARTVDLGSMTDLRVVVARQAPVTLIVPALKKFVGLD